MTISIDMLKKLNGYNFVLEHYKLNHSELTLSAVNPIDTSLRFTLGFSAVAYIQMPIGWNGNFELGSEDEKVELIKRQNLLWVEQSIDMYKSNQGKVIILGFLMQIEPASA